MEKMEKKCGEITYKLENNIITAICGYRKWRKQISPNLARFVESFKFDKKPADILYIRYIDGGIKSIKLPEIFENIYIESTEPPHIIVPKSGFYLVMIHCKNTFINEDFKHYTTIIIGDLKFDEYGDHITFIRHFYLEKGAKITVQCTFFNKIEYKFGLNFLN